MTLENVLILFLISVFVSAAIFHSHKHFAKFYIPYCLMGFLVYGYYIRNEIHRIDNEAIGHGIVYQKGTSE